MNSVPEQNRNDRSNASAEAEQPAQQGQGEGANPAERSPASKDSNSSRTTRIARARSQRMKRRAVSAAIPAAEEQEEPRAARLLPQQTGSVHVRTKPGDQPDDQDHVPVSPGENHNNGAMPLLPRAKPWRDGVRTVPDRQARRYDSQSWCSVRLAGIVPQGPAGRSTRIRMRKARRCGISLGVASGPDIAQAYARVIQEQRDDFSDLHLR